MFAKSGDALPPCGIPSSTRIRFPSSSTPAFSHFWMSRTTRRSANPVLDELHQPAVVDGVKETTDVQIPFYQLDPVWTDEFMATGAGIYGSGVMPPKETELLSIAFDASYTHMYAPGTRRHIHNALQAGATMEEIMEVLKLCVVQGVQACNLGVPILAEELAHHAGHQQP